MDFVVTMQTGHGVQQFVVTADDEVAAAELLARHEAERERRHYRGVRPGSRVDVVWRNVAFPDWTIQPAPNS